MQHKLLVIDEEFPYPLNSGKRIRTFNLVKALSRYNSITYLAYGHERSDSFDYLMAHGITPIAVSPPNLRQHGIRFYGRLFANLFSAYPYIVTSHYTRRFHRLLARTASSGAFDLVICEWTPYAIFIKDLKAPKKIIVAHNIESSIWRRYESNETNPLRKAYISLQRSKVERFERRCFGWADGATAVSAADAEQLAATGAGYPVEVIDNGVDTEYYCRQQGEIDANMLVFTGAMDWRPNQDAAVYFVNEILPLIRRRRPDTTVAFVGRNPSRKVIDLGSTEGVTVTGTVDDVRPYIARAAVYIVPLRVGGGSRLKILEAMAMKKAIVSTDVGVEGLHVTADENILVAGEARAFARSVIRCLEDETLRGRLGDNGRRMVEQKYRWDLLGEKLHNYICSILDAK